MGFEFRNRQQIGISDNQFLVVGGIEFRCGSEVWQEYCLTDVNSKQEFWLSIDKANDEYAVFRAERNNGQFRPDALASAGYHQVDVSRATVANTFGAVDAEIGDTVKSTTYEDNSEEEIMSVEQWEDEIEYSSGYYLDWDEIKIGGIDNQGAMGGAAPWDNPSGNAWDNGGGHHPWDNASSSPDPEGWSFGSDLGKGNNKRGGIIIAAVIGIFMFFCMFGSCITSSCSGLSSGSGVVASQTTISAHLKANPSKYTYETAVTSDLNDREFAYVYTSNQTIKDAAEDIVNAVALDNPDVQDSDDGKTVTIMTPNEYAVVYQGKEGNTKTHVQVSARSYAYESSNGLHNGSENANNHYRGFYFIRGYDHDRSRYSSRRHGYSGYDRSHYRYNPNNSYQSYARKRHQSAVRSVRQNSTSNRSFSNSSRSSSRSSSRRMGK